MIWTVLLSILILYVLSALVKELIRKKFHIDICAVCVAVSLTWIVLLIMLFSGIYQDKLLIGILMGQSIAGSMYAFEKKFQKNESVLAFKILIILFGTAVVYYLLV